MLIQLAIFRNFWNSVFSKHLLQLINTKCSHSIETRQLIYKATQWVGFYMIGLLTKNG